MEIRKTAAATQSGLSDGSGKLVIPPNPYRAAMILSDPSGAQTYIILGSDDTSGKGAFLPTNGTPLILTANDLGTAIQGAITLINAAGAVVTFAWIEITTAP